MNGSRRKPLNNSRSGTPVPPSSGREAASLQARLAAKDLWKREAGHRYTPEELKRMSEVAEVKIHRRKRVVMRLAADLPDLGPAVGDVGNALSPVTRSSRCCEFHSPQRFAAT
jgi:hypothetical protein